MKSLPHSKAKDVFTHLLATIMLYASVIGLLTLCFHYIDLVIPDALDWGGAEAKFGTIRGMIAMLIIVWPVYLGVSWMINHDAHTTKEKTPTTIHRWLTYLTLFCASLVIVVDLVTLLNYLLNGEVTTRFIAKVVVVLAVAVAVGAYYGWDILRDMRAKTNVPRIAAGLGSSVVLVAIVLGFLAIGSPAEQRRVRADELRVGQLESMQSAIASFYEQNKRLPEGKDELGWYAKAVEDPAVEASIEYTKHDEGSFELCATFERKRETNPYGDRYGRYAGDPYDWSHDEGRVCFTRMINALVPGAHDKMLLPAPVRESVGPEEGVQ